MTACNVWPFLYCIVAMVTCVSSWNRLFSPDRKSLVKTDIAASRNYKPNPYVETGNHQIRYLGYGSKHRLFVDQALKGHKPYLASQTLSQPLKELLPWTASNNPSHSNNRLDGVNCSRELLYTYGLSGPADSKDCAKLLHELKTNEKRHLEKTKADIQRTTTSLNTSIENSLSRPELQENTHGDMAAHDTFASSAGQQGKPSYEETVTKPSPPLVYHGDVLLGSLFLDSTPSPERQYENDLKQMELEQPTESLSKPIQGEQSEVSSSGTEQSFKQGQGEQPAKRGHLFCPIPMPMANPISENDPLPWTCTQHKRWRSLDDDYYPNQLRETVCESRSCMGGHYNCTPITHTTHLLRACRDRECNDERTPTGMRRIWRFEDIEVTVGCMCSR